MYKDEIWYRKLEEALDEHRDDFSDKQWDKYRIDLLLKVANRVRTFSDDCETCRSYQHRLTRLEEEIQELPDSKAQRQYQREQLYGMAQHFVAEHQLAPPGFFLRKYLRVGLIAGAVLGFAAMLAIGNLLIFPLGILLGGGMAALYGWTEDQRYERKHQRI
jgi:hypothetical protein